MISSTLAAFLILQAAPAAEYKTLADAAEAIAADQDKAAALERITRAGKPGLWALCEVAKKKSGLERGRLYDAIGTFATPEAEWALIVELKKADPQTRAGIIRGLAHIKNPANYRHIIDAASSADEGVRSAAADALVELGPKVFDRVQPLLTSTDPRVRSVGLAFVARAGNRTMIEQTVPGALKDSQPEVQYQAIALAVRSDDPVHTGELGRLARLPNEKVAHAAVEAIARLRGANGAYDLAAIAADRATLEPVSKKAAELARSYQEKGLRGFLDAVESANGMRRDQLAGMLGGSLTDAELQVIVDALGDPSPKRAALARDVLEKTGERGASIAFARLSNAQAPLRGALIEYLRRRSGASFAGKLLERARSGAIEERMASIDLLGEIGEPASLSALAELLHDPSPEIRARVAAVVSGVSDRAIARALISIAKDESPVVRAGALKGLRRWIPDDREAVAVARRALSDSEESVRIAAIRALAKPRDVAVVHAFRTRLFEASITERAAIAEALGASALPEAVVMLVDLATDNDDLVRQTAVAALGVAR